jgi:predicted RNase H-related nuclease YkuK (DUF458 family)
MKAEHLEKLKTVKQAIAASDPTSKVYVGCDSKRLRKSGEVRFATVVILHIKGKHGGMMWSFMDKEMDYNPVNNPRMRLVTEAYKAVEIAAEIVDVVGDRDFEVHLDLNTNPKHKSNVAVKEALGYVLGVMGFDAKLKPEAWASSTAADKLTK